MGKAVLFCPDRLGSILGSSIEGCVDIALAEIGDKELKTLIEKDLEERAQRGRPQNDA